jgi:23S rRNA pseudouridine1911/1915/1917 synthase
MSEAPVEAERYDLTLTGQHHGMRLDQVLAECIGGYSRNYLKQLIQEGAATVDGRLVQKPSSKVSVGQHLSIDIRPTEQSQAFVAQDIPLDVVYQDDSLLVLNKPAGLVVHPAAGNWSGTVLNGLLALDNAHKTLPRAGIVHRLDKDTSGLMVVARTRKCMDALVTMLAAREVSRQYVAIAHREWVRPTDVTVSQPIGRDPGNRVRMAVVDLERHMGKAAITHLHCLQSLDSDPAYCLVQAKLETGRTHQIRVHMGHQGHPLVGDALYGGHAALGMTRQALHAFSLQFAHPENGRWMAFSCPVPADMAFALSSLGWDTIIPDPLDGQCKPSL